MSRSPGDVMTNEHHRSPLPGAAVLGAAAVLIALLMPPAPADPTGFTASAAVRIDVNTADAAHLTALPRIGPAIAARILADRGANGPFPVVDDLTRVSGVGPKTLHRLRPFVRVGPAESAFRGREPIRSG